MSAKKIFKSKITLIVSVVTILTLTAIAAALKKAEFKSPQGRFSVGTFHLELKDSRRTNSTLQVQVYYPAKDTHSGYMPYHPNPEVLEQDLENLYGIPGVLIRKISRAEVPVKPHAAAFEAQAGFPILLFSHGYNGSRFQNSYLLPQLASHGYVIASIEHTGSAAGTVSLNGDRGGITPFDSITKNEPFSNREILEWSADQIFVFNTLQGMVQDGRLPVQLYPNFDKAGVFGHSFGGATAANTLSLDKRLKAGINLDGFYFGQGHQSGFTQPFMELRADNKPAAAMSEGELEEWQMSRDQYEDFLFVAWNRRLKGLAREGYESYVLKGANHMSFTDFSLMYPFGFLTAPQREVHHEATLYLVRNFFDKHLKGRVENTPPGNVSAIIKAN